MLAIFKREIRAFFTSPVGFVFLAMYLAVANLFFYMYNVYAQSSDVSSTFSNMLFIMSFIVPMLTMRLLAEEKKQRTEQLLYTAPVKIIDIVMGKYLASVLVFLLAMIGTLTWPMIITMYGHPSFATILGNYIGLFTAGAAFIAIGLFISSLTENQIIAAIVTFVVYLGLYLMTSFAGSVDSVLLSRLVNWFSIFSRYANFAVGLMALDDIVYFFSLTVVFLFLTTRVIERKRWA